MYTEGKLKGHKINQEIIRSVEETRNHDACESFVKPRRSLSQPQVNREAVPTDTSENDEFTDDIEERTNLNKLVHSLFGSKPAIMGNSNKFGNTPLKLPSHSDYL